MKVMKGYKKYLGLAFVIGMTIGIQSCVNESPFDNGGEGSLKMLTQVRSDVTISTRAIDGYPQDILDSKLIVYISQKGKGLIRKYLGKESIPEIIKLPVGGYVIEGWTGDSVPADWNKKFFSGYDSDVYITDGGENSFLLKLDLANVVVAVNKESLNQQISELQITISHPGGSLTYTNDEISNEKRGYFMMPFGCDYLDYIITCKNASGQDVKPQTGKIKVKKSHLYKLNVIADEDALQQGGALIKIQIEESDPIHEYVDILPAPAFKALYGEDPFDLDNILTPNDEGFQDFKIRTLAYKHLESLALTFSENIGDLTQYNGINLLSDANAKNILSQRGIKLDETIENPSGEVTAIEAWITFSSTFLNELGDEEYEIKITANDGKYTNSKSFSIAKHVDPVSSSKAPTNEENALAILSRSAELILSIFDNTASDYGIEYSEIGKNDFKKVSAKSSGNIVLATRGNSNLTYSIKLENLKCGTTYEYRAYSDNFVENQTRTFTTEPEYTIENADMEQWSTDTDGKKDNAIIPTSGNSVSYWDTGNHGSVTLGVNLTQSFDIDGNTVAKLRSQNVAINGLPALGKFGAGNLFIGRYVDTDGTNGVLEFGREFDGSHPSSLNVMVNYQPGLVDRYGKNDSYLSQGKYDHGQIYIALTTGTVEIRTKNAQKLFDPDGDYVVAYGQVSFDDEDGKGFGEDGKLKLVNIPLKYKSKAKTVVPTHIVIVCSASKYGDYFCGGEGSTMYVDDFELLYDKDPEMEN